MRPGRRSCASFVMAGLDPAIQPDNESPCLCSWIAASSAAMTMDAKPGERSCP